MTNRQERWKVLIVDDSEDFLAVACSWIATQPSFDLVGTACNGAEAVGAVARLRPELIVMDAFMPVVDGFEATRRIKSQPEAPWVVVVSVHEGVAMEHEAWAAGADGFVPKADLATRMPALLRTLVHRATGPARPSAQRQAPQDRAPNAEPEDGPIETRGVTTLWSRFREALRSARVLEIVRQRSSSTN